MQKPAGRPWVIAHRGASHALRENTLPAFREAFARGADAAELDVRRTSDGVLVVHHDAVVPGGGPIIEMTRDDIEQFAPWIPDLEQALAACAGMWVNVEIKNSPADPDWDESQQAAHLTAAVLREIGPADRFLVSSFNPDTIETMSEIFPEVGTGWLSDVGIEPIQATRHAAAAGHASIHPYVDAMAGDKASAVVSIAKEAGLLVIVWIVDDAAEMVRLAEAGIDGIITNQPGAARSAFEHRNGDGG
ncbi:MAG: glycerophosphodiester phosphodiesterase [Acidimicrobiia bacterium]|nr:glycerophosphodiester phosphodiesterase [Acidimicrobiia bacterium]